MAKFRNDTGSVLTVNDLSRQVGPGEEFDWPGYDPGVHGVIPGCVRIDEPVKPLPKRTKGADEQDKETGE